MEHTKQSINQTDYNSEKIEILYKDQHIVVINKPAGLLSVPYTGCKSKTAQSVLGNILRKQGAANTKYKPYAVHRLDRDTSGVMMFALTEQAQKKIMNSWHSIVTKRLYRAVAEKPKKIELDNEGLITDELAQNSHNIGFVPKNNALNKNGKAFKTVAARTHYKMLEIGATHVLFELSLDTGKKNQIRAHLAFHGFPLAGDKEHRAKTDYFHRLCLHARTLEFIHPFTDEHMKFEVKEPKSWLDYVKKGDTHAAKFAPKTEKSKTKHKSIQSLDLGKKRLTRKQAAHMNFIEQGKYHR